MEARSLPSTSSDDMTTITSSSMLTADAVSRTVGPSGVGRRNRTSNLSSGYSDSWMLNPSGNVRLQSSSSAPSISNAAPNQPRAMARRVSSISSARVSLQRAFTRL
jgi:hypothetical protein